MTNPEDPRNHPQHQEEPRPDDGQGSDPRPTYEAAPGAIEGEASGPASSTEAHGPAEPGQAPAAPPPQPAAPPPATEPQPPQAPPYVAPQRQRPPQGPAVQQPQPQQSPPPQQPPRAPYSPPPAQQPPPYGYPPHAQQYGRAPQPPFGPYGGGPYGPQGPRRRNRVVPLVVGLVMLFFVVVVGVVGLLSAATSSGAAAGAPSLSLFGQKVAVLEIDGVLGAGPTYTADTEVLVEQVKKWTENSNIRALVLKINSPGGAVAATQDLYHAIQDFRTSEGGNRPVLASMGDIAASGGYYAAMGADEVYANEGTLTGSIGVILNFMDYQGLQEKIGIRPRNVKSGKFKDMGSGSRAMTLEEQELLNEMVDDVFQQFFQVVVENRGPVVVPLIAQEQGIAPEDVNDEQVRQYVLQYADGRIFSGRQAATTGMIDGTATLDDVLARAREMAGLPENAPTVTAPVAPTGLFGSISSLANRMNGMAADAGMARMEYRFHP